ncbi:hypothetical protein HZI73_22245 [Vallitalea pronyensis]|uniref:Uncharacterized protein n=1 Tax=Vallitalea pronyensis TaxID=1348613 RepID=A0A8J8SIT7_9FIRM|nr:hypothetical protein [Vallitalea pronyensis]QUI24853.1 hypothetical protein HZI73_22245 [Vallitalea pronyensis]
MFLVEGLINLILGILNVLLPVFGLSDDFLTSLDMLFSKFIDLLMTVGFFIDFNIFVSCILVMIAVDNYILLFRVGQWIIGIVRGSG